MIRSDDLHFLIYTRHGDSCNCVPGQCASGYQPHDYVLAAKHAYFQEAIDVAVTWAARGVNCRIKSTAVKPNTWHEYPARKATNAA
jgi:hypothetical protein